MSPIALALRLAPARLARRSSRGASAVEFGICITALLMFLCGTLDFGLAFGGYFQLESGVAASGRAASVGQYAYSGASTCSGGPTTATAQLVCAVASQVGSPSGAISSSLLVGVCFVTPGSAPSCAGQAGTGTSVTQDVEVCARLTLSSTTGVMAPFLNNRTVTSSSRLVIEQPQPSGSTTGFAAFNAGSAAVTYGSETIKGLNCS